jgi:hypothetical protein
MLLAQTPPETRRANWNKKLIYIVHLAGYFHNYITMHGLANVKDKRVSDHDIKAYRGK